MDARSPRLWPYTPTNSPVALPQECVFFCSTSVIPLQFPKEESEEVLESSSLQAYCAQFSSGEGTVEQLLAQHNAPAMSERRIESIPVNRLRPFSPKGFALPNSRVKLSAPCLSEVNEEKVLASCCCSKTVCMSALSKNAFCSSGNSLPSTKG